MLPTVSTRGAIMVIDRRVCLLGCAGGLYALMTDALAQAQSKKRNNPPVPSSAAFQSGDFLWPKKPGAYIPYNSGHTTARQADESRWLRERDQCVANLRRNPGYFTPQQVLDLESLTYAQFYARYLAGMEPGKAANYSAEAANHVGHVAIIDIDDKATPWVIEAVLADGVIRQPYQAWLAARQGDMVWHGRLKNVASANRLAIAPEANKYVGRPYDFWNFDLGDDRGFYCSKLAWLAVFRALKVSLDGNSNPQRTFWLSPKQLLNVAGIEVLHSPGPY